MEIVLGTAQLTQAYGVTFAARSVTGRGQGLLAAAEELGIRALDTAPAYGAAETFIGSYGGHFAIHTKLPRSGDPARELAASLQRLARTDVEILYLHDPDVILDPMSPTLAAASKLVGAGAQGLGASIYTPEQFHAAVADDRITAIQLPLNLFDRRVSEGAIGAAASQGVRIFARSVLLQGLLAAPSEGVGKVPGLDEPLKTFARAAAELDRSPVELAIGWVREVPGLSGVVLGAEDADQLHRLAAAVEAPRLSHEERDMLRAIPIGQDAPVDPRHWGADRAAGAERPPR